MCTFGAAAPPAISNYPASRNLLTVAGRQLLVHKAAIPLLIGNGVVMRNQANQVARVAVLPGRQARQLFDCGAYASTHTHPHVIGGNRDETAGDAAQRVTEEQTKQPL